MLHDGKFRIKLGLPSGNAFPTSPAPTESDVFYREDLDKVYTYDGAAWNELGAVGEGHIILFPPSYSSIGQGTWIMARNINVYFSWQTYNSSNANGDNLSYTLYLDAGTYTLYLLHDTAPNRGIMDIDIGGVEVASWDLYSAGPVYNIRKTQAGINIAAPGITALKIRVDGKNGASSDHYLSWQYVALWRTA